VTFGQTAIDGSCRPADIYDPRHELSEAGRFMFDIRCFSAVGQLNRLMHEAERIIMERNRDGNGPSTEARQVAALSPQQYMMKKDQAFRESLVE